MFRLIEADPPAEQVQQVTFVPFLPDGWCVLIERAGGPGLPAAQTLRSLGFACHGQTSGGERPGRPRAPSAWIDAPP